MPGRHNETARPPTLAGAGSTTGFAELRDEAARPAYALDARAFAPAHRCAGPADRARGAIRSAFGRRAGRACGVVRSGLGRRAGRACGATRSALGQRAGSHYVVGARRLAEEPSRC
ncbi:hypothetical protein [Paractinoplanes brasiliensis]|uniref:Uncharacterized protein n=1 Tax=Paractinoplanes brasiliensis TaxID=52695 RepID=A0A4R6K4D3_9ACTN|nr:hypothetical protein [Actinoplanes brasiliensis]TDO42135.1 hypothetical protein C8E87_5899 [Actinoplanes brasiliensis]GID32000.1 hypothetical protein Abr02nite_69830 [Actinoplanes brasiliensis]